MQGWARGGMGDGQQGAGDWGQGAAHTGGLWASGQGAPGQGRALPCKVTQAPRSKGTGDRGCQQARLCGCSKESKLLLITIASRAQGCKATICMPVNTPKIKVGGRVLLGPGWRGACCCTMAPGSGGQAQMLQMWTVHMGVRQVLGQA